MALAELFPAAERRDDESGWGWPLLLIAAALLSSVTFACVTPFAAFALLAAATMPLPRALATMVAIWLVNQALGFGGLGYPFDAMTLAWGAAIGIAALAGTVAAALVAGLTPRRQWLRLAAGFAAAFVAYEGLLFLVALGLGGTANFAPDIVAKLAFSDGCWLFGVAILRHGLLRLEAARRARRPVTT